MTLLYIMKGKEAQVQVLKLTRAPRRCQERPTPCVLLLPQGANSTLYGSICLGILIESAVLQYAPASNLWNPGHTSKPMHICHACC